jgi:hypothetical protein
LDYPKKKTILGSLYSILLRVFAMENDQFPIRSLARSADLYKKIFIFQDSLPTA